MKRDVLEELILNINSRTGIKNEILEKDYYVCLILKQLSERQGELQTYFKGGTAVYKILNHMNRFSEDIDLTVKVNDNESNTSNRNRLKKSALNYIIEGLNLNKTKTIDEKGSITSFYEYESLFSFNELFKAGVIQIEATSFTVSEPVGVYTIEPLIYRYATEEEKQILKNSYDISEFEIGIIKLERIFIDKIFASEFYYIRSMYDDVAKHLYDIAILFKNKDIQKFLENKTELLQLISYKREEEKYRIGGIDENIKIKDFNYLHSKLDSKVTKAFLKMQRIYVLDEESRITIKNVNDTLEQLVNLFAMYDF